MTDPIAQEVVNFWIDAGTQKWWKKDPEFDAEIRRRFGQIHQQACRGECDHWAATPEGALALILVLDQFSRNLHRNSPLAFAQDGKSAALVKALVEAGKDQKMPSDVQAFCYLPLVHSEDLANQQQAVDLMRALGWEVALRSAIEHRDIIAEFGRFPHRNKVLGRETTAAEQAFLDAGGFAG
ncbi:MAG: DUF924 family protein [Rhizobiaceae bacterium]|nr:DUF924 family protein [Rhizobiaceae bacterium]